jgi:hypothetical protein
MSSAEFGFYFEEAGRGPAQGAIDPAEQFFEGSMAEESLARETGQNSTDHPAGNGPVTMVFEMASMPVEEIPGIEGLRAHIDAAELQTSGRQGHDRMRQAKETARHTHVQVLRVGDYNTTGLTGTESIDDPHSALSALTRGAGISANDGSRGGSFGIGSAVGPMASDLCTVLYTSMTKDSSDVVFAGSCRLASHRDTDGTWRVANGFFTDLGDQKDFRYLRNPSPLGPFEQRTEPGTDLYVLAYRKAADDPTLEHIKVAFLNNFLVAIHRGDLIVKGVTEAGTWELNQETLAHHVHSHPEVSAFYRAIQDPTPIHEDSARFGRISLYVNVDDSLDRTLHTITMRRPHMKIDTFRHTSIPAKYAAVLECADEKGNTLLRKLEPPQHHEWDAGRARGGAAALKELKDFVRDGLRSRVKQELGDNVEIKGLERFLPAVVFEDSGSGTAEGGRPADGQGTDEESSTVHGADGEPRPAFNKGRRSVRVGVRTAADSDGDAVSRKGKDRGGKRTRRGAGGGLPGTGGAGDGSSRIDAGDVRFRSWTDGASSDLCIALTASEDLSGELELVALGPGGTSEDDYVLPIETAVLQSDDGETSLPIDGNVLANVALKAGVTSQVRLRLATSHRYRLGVK